MKTRWRSIWHVASAIPLEGGEEPAKGTGVKVLPGHTAYDGRSFHNLLRLSFDLESSSIEDAYVSSSDLAQVFVDRLCLASFARAEAVEHLVTAREFCEESGFSLLSSGITAHVGYNRAWSLSPFDAEGVSAETARALRQFRRAFAADVRAEALLMLYRSLEPLAEAEADPNFVECSVCNHRTQVGRKTKQKILGWLIEAGCEQATAKEFVTRVRNLVAHGSSGHTLAAEEQFALMFSGIAPKVAAILRVRGGVPTVCGENMVFKRPFVVYECAYDDRRESVKMVTSRFRTETVLMQVGTDWKDTPLIVVVRAGLENDQLSMKNLEPLLPWIIPKQNA